MLEYSELRAFIAVARHLNFSKAAIEIGLSAPQLSKVVATLERKLKCKLLNRTTRSVRLTNDGASFLIAANRAFESLQEANQMFELNTSPGELSGTVRITAPNTLGTRFLSTPLRLFTEKYPKVKVQVLLSDTYMDFVDDDIDVALRIMNPKDSSLVAKKVAANPVSFYAAPSYLTKHPAQLSVRDLVRHKVFCITPHLKLKFLKSKLTLEDCINSPSIQCTNGDLLVDIAVQGHGLLVRSEWGVDKEVRLGQLVKLTLNDSLHSESGIFVVYQKHHHAPRRVKAFTETLIKSLKISQ